MSDNPFQPAGLPAPSEEAVQELVIRPSMELGACMSEGARLWVKLGPPVVLTVLVATTIYTAISWGLLWTELDFEAQTRINNLVGSLANAVQLGAIGVVIARAKGGESTSMGAAFIGGLGLCIPLMILNIPVGLGVFCGVLLFLIPGIYLAVRLSLVHVAYALDPHLGIGGALKQSWAYTEGRFWPTFLLGLVTGVVAVVLLLVYIGAGLAWGEIVVLVGDLVPFNALLVIDFVGALTIDLVMAWPLMFTWFPLMVYYAGIREMWAENGLGVTCPSCGSLQTELVGGIVVCHNCGERSPSADLGRTGA